MAAAAPDNQSDFNPRVYDAGAPYCGDVGTLWCVVGCSYQYPNVRQTLHISPAPEAMPGDFSDLSYGGAEHPGNYYFGCVTVSQGLIAGDLVGDFPPVDKDGDPPLNAPGGTSQAVIMQRAEHVVRADKEFLRGALARFYPPTSFLWEGAAGTQGVLSVRTSDVVGVVRLPNILITSPDVGDYVTLSWGSDSFRWRMKVTIIDLDEENDERVITMGGAESQGGAILPAQDTTVFVHSNKYAAYVGTAGKPFLTRQRGTKLWMMTAAVVAVDPWFFDQVEGYNEQYGTFTDRGQIYAKQNKGERVLVGDIYQTEDAEPLVTTSSYEAYGTATAYTGKIFDAIYENAGILTLDTCWHHGFKGYDAVALPNVNGSMYGVGNDSLFFLDPETYSTFTGAHQVQGPVHIEGMAWVQRRIIAYEVVPYDSDRTGTASSGGDRGEPHYMEGLIQIAHMIYPHEYPDETLGIEGTVDPAGWLTDELTSHYPILPAPRDTPWMVGRTPNQKSLCCGRFTWLQDDQYAADNPGTFQQEFRIDPRPEYGFAVIAVDELTPLTGIAPLEGTVAFELHLLIPDPLATPRNEKVYDRAFGTFGASYTMECRGYDRLIENECRGPVECVLWTEGMLPKNDVFHVQTPLVYPPPSNDPTFVVRRQWDDYHVTNSAPIVDFSMDMGILQGYEDIMPNPTRAGLWIRRWKKNQVLGEYVAYDEAFGPDDPENADASWVIERFDILETGYVPIACCLTPWGDPIYLMLQPWPAANPPLNEGATERENRYFKLVYPGHWTLTFRLAMPQIDGDEVIGIQTAEGDYIDTDWQGSFGGLDEARAWSRNRSPISISCNEHTLFLKNVPALFWGRYLTDAERENLGDNPSNADLTALEPASFASVVLPYDSIENQDPSWIVADSEYFQTVAYEWSIDLATGKIRWPWRTHGAMQRDAELPEDYYPLGTVDLTQSNRDAGLFVGTGAFDPSKCGRSWYQPKSQDLLNDDDFRFRYRWKYAAAQQQFSRASLDNNNMNSASGWDTVQHVEGYSPRPVPY